MGDPTPEPPRNFSWCEEKVLAASAYPGQKEHLLYMIDNGIGCLVSLTEESEVSRHDIDDKHLEIVRIPVTDFSAPTLEQVQSFLEVTKRVNSDGKAVCVHCRGGVGRTGTMLACYYVDHDALSADEAIKRVRSLRPRSIETPDQEMVVYAFADQKKKAAH